MFASWRAELLVLRKSRVAWVLVALAPLSVLITTYVFGFLEYDLLTPAQYEQFGTPSQMLAPLLPDQFVIETVNTLWQTAPFVLLGAVMAGSDWGRGTIRTALLQGPGRTRTFAGQVLGVLTASTVSVLGCFALAGIASLTIDLAAGRAAGYAYTPSPSLATVGEAVGAGLVTGIAYTTLGIAFGTLCRSAAGAVAAALIWYVLVEQFLYDLSTDTGGWFTRVYDGFPAASKTTLTSMFGSPGGGADSATYQPVPASAAAAILGCYTLVSLALALVLVRRRDVTRSAGREPRHHPRRRRRGTGAPLSTATPSRVALPGIRASLRAELAVIARWPAMWAFVLVYPAETLLWGYVSQFILYLRAAHGAIILASPDQVLTNVLPGQLLPVVLNGFWAGPALPGTAACFSIGALAAGSTWASGTIKTAVLQAPSRARTTIGHALAVGAAVLASILLTFLLAGLASLVLAVGLTGSPSPAAGPLPAAHQLAAAVGLATLVGLAWGAAGWAVATVLRSTTAAFAAILLFSTLVEAQLDQLSTELTGAMRTLYELLPDASSNTLSFMYGQVDYGYQIGFVGLTPALAIAVLVAYTIAAFVLSLLLAVRRNLA
jgi:ABC-type transport system involved in multi-copper enzyme maturation permease subunit